MKPNPAIVAKLWSSDLTNVEIAQRSGYQPPSLNYVRRRLGLPKRKRGAKPERLTQAQRAALDGGRAIANARWERRQVAVPRQPTAITGVLFRCCCGGASTSADGHPTCQGRAA